jgi:signal recognition particle subunit SRP19
MSKPASTKSSESKKDGRVSGIPNISYSTKQRWRIIYPIYINKKHTIPEGRRVPLAKAIERPTILDIAEIAIQLDLPYIIEQDKGYSRDFMQLGRIRVQLKDDNGNPLNKLIQSKKQFLFYCCDNINNLKNRPARIEKLIKMEQQETNFFQSAQEKAQEKKEQNMKEAESTAASGGNKKKNKGKKKK